MLGHIHNSPWAWSRLPELNIPSKYGFSDHVTNLELSFIVAAQPASHEIIIQSMTKTEI